MTQGALTLVGLVFGVVGSYFLASGSLRMKPDTIAYLSSTRVGFNS
jgi:hypothetical protein